jgi:AraC-like DNA-binding protein
VAEKRFTEEGITIDTPAARLGTNRNYLSRHINTVKQQTFRNWINTLRIEEAKTLMLQNPGITIGEIALRVGIPDKSNFTRSFGKQTSLSPQAWRKQAGRK